MDEINCMIASNLTAAFYAGSERRRPYLGEERREIVNSPIQPDRLPNISIQEVFYVYQRFLSMLDSSQDKTVDKRSGEK